MGGSRCSQDNGHDFSLKGIDDGGARPKINYGRQGMTTMGATIHWGTFGQGVPNGGETALLKLTWSSKNGRTRLRLQVKSFEWQQSTQMFSPSRGMYYTFYTCNAGPLHEILKAY